MVLNLNLNSAHAQRTWTVVVVKKYKKQNHNHRQQETETAHNTGASEVAVALCSFVSFSFLFSMRRGALSPWWLPARTVNCIWRLVGSHGLRITAARRILQYTSCYCWFCSLVLLLCRCLAGTSAVLSLATFATLATLRGGDAASLRW